MGLSWPSALIIACSRSRRALTLLLETLSRLTSSLHTGGESPNRSSAKLDATGETIQLAYDADAVLDRAHQALQRCALQQADHLHALADWVGRRAF